MIFREGSGRVHDRRVLSGLRSDTWLPQQCRTRAASILSMAVSAPTEMTFACLFVVISEGAALTLAYAVLQSIMRRVQHADQLGVFDVSPAIGSVVGFGTLFQVLGRAGAARSVRVAACKWAFRSAARASPPESVPTLPDVHSNLLSGARWAEETFWLVGLAIIAPVWCGGTLFVGPSASTLALLAGVSGLAWTLTPSHNVEHDISAWWSGRGRGLLSEDERALRRLLAFGADLAARDMWIRRLSREQARVLGSRPRAGSVFARASLALGSIACLLGASLGHEAIGAALLAVIAGARIGLYVGGGRSRPGLTSAPRAGSPKDGVAAAAGPPLASRAAAAAAEVELVNVARRPSDGASAKGSLRFPAGELTVIIGADGSGRDQLLDTLLGCPQPKPRWNLSVDGATLDASSLPRWRSACARVPALTLILRGSVAENLRLAAPGAMPEELWSAITACGLLERLRADGLALRLGPGGAPLSRLEVRRLSLARALLRTPRVLVVEESEEGDVCDAHFKGVLCGLRGRCTVVLGARNARALEFADHVALVRDGAVLESGAVEALLRDSSSEVARLWARTSKSSMT